MGHNPPITPPAKTGLPDVILVGDSHVLALQQGCEALGLNAAMLKSGGIHWNQGKIRVFPIRRGRSPVMPALQPRVEELQAQMGVRDVFDGSVPVIASIGFHCGHLARAFGRQGHVAWPPPKDLADEGGDHEVMFASGAVQRAFIEDRRERHFALLKYIGQRCKLTAVLPPRAPKNEDKIRFRHNIDALTNTITRRIRAGGTDVYDPNTDFVEDDQLLPWEWVNDDGFHGTPAYGKLVMERLVARGALDPVKAPTA